jgi:hypothetical protein
LEGLAQNIRSDPAALADGWQITLVVLAVVGGPNAMLAAVNAT